MSAPVVPEAYRRALLALRTGENGVSQEHTVRRHLRAMESAGLVRYTDGAWFLTSEGRVVVAAAEVSP